MPEKVAQAVKCDVLNMATKGTKQDDIADYLGICFCMILCARSKLHKYGDIEGRTKKRGRKPKLIY